MIKSTCLYLSFHTSWTAIRKEHASASNGEFVGMIEEEAWSLWTPSSLYKDHPIPPTYFSLTQEASTKQYIDAEQGSTSCMVLVFGIVSLSNCVLCFASWSASLHYWHSRNAPCMTCKICCLFCCKIRSFLIFQILQPIKKLNISFLFFHISYDTI